MSKSTLASNTDSGETRSERAETAAPEGKDSLEQPYLSAGPRLLPIPGSHLGNRVMELHFPDRSDQRRVGR